MKRASGVLMHVSTLWGNYSEGSFGKAAKEWIDFLSDCGFSYWQVLPFCLPDDCNSPYKSFSAFSGNPNFIDLDELAEDGLLTPSELESARQDTPYYCEFDRLSEERLSLLAKAADRFDGWDKADAFLASHPHTEKFCTFIALRKANGEKPWQEWTTDTPDAAALKVWRFSQYIFYTQWQKIRAYANEKGVKIIGDIPIYVASDSADTKFFPELFQLDSLGYPKRVAGCPPDYFCEDGQLWGNPLYDWDRMKKDGYKWWRERIGFMTELFDGVRIDHFRGLESYYSIPAEAETARDGKWVKGPGMDLINAIKEDAGDALIIAEDLGDIDDAVRRLVDDSGFPGMRVFQFAFFGNNNSPHLPHSYINNCVAYTGTHDNNTLLGFIWENAEHRDEILEYCGYDSPDWNSCYDSILRTMFSSGAGLMILPVQDLLLYGSDTRMNKPGEKDGNWSLRLTKEQISSVNKEKFRRWNEIYGRM